MSAANQPTKIDKLADGAAVQRTHFLYGPERQRTRQLRRAMSGSTEGAVQDIVYYGGAIEREIDHASSKTVMRTYLPLGLGYAEESFTGTATSRADSAPLAAKYFHRDRLGSLALITNASRAAALRLRRLGPPQAQP